MTTEHTEFKDWLSEVITDSLDMDWRASTAARLIVERIAEQPVYDAAPDLLREAKTAVEELEYFVEFAIRQIEFEGDGDAGLLAVKNLRAAINRAEGRS